MRSEPSYTGTYPGFRAEYPASVRKKKICLEEGRVIKSWQNFKSASSKESYIFLASMINCGKESPGEVMDSSPPHVLRRRLFPPEFHSSYGAQYRRSEDQMIL